MNIKLIIEDVLQKIDTFFKDKSSKDMNMIYIMVAMVSGLGAYPFYDVSVEDSKKITTEVGKMRTMVELDKIYLKQNPETKLTELDTQMVKLKNDFLAEKQKNTYIKERVESISSLLYNEKAWGEYVDSISTNARTNGVKVINLTNKYVDSNESFGHVLDISVEVSGKYLNTLKFINSLERSDLVVDVHDLNISAKDTLESKIDISVWGITYR